MKPHPGSFPSTVLPILSNILKAAPKQLTSSEFLLTPIPGFIALPYPKDLVVCPAKTTSQYLYVDDQCVIINDAFPKSTIHLLVLPRDPTLKSLNDLTSGHVGLLKHMMDVTTRYTELVLKKLIVSKTVDLSRFRYISGFHGIPSIPTLHMHHLSMDLESDCLKNKKHYNSFATHFFLPAASVLENLTKNGRVTLNQAVDELHQLENGPMSCLWCGTALGSMPGMKDHVRQCKSNASRIAVVGKDEPLPHRKRDRED